MATKREKGVTLNSRGVYEIRLAGKYRGCRKTLKEANAFSLEIQNGLAKEEKKQYIATGKTGKKIQSKKTITVKTKSAKVPGYNYSDPVQIPPPNPIAANRYVPAGEMFKRIETMPQKKESFWSKLKKAIFKD